MTTRELLVVILARILNYIIVQARVAIISIHPVLKLGQMPPFKTPGGRFLPLLLTPFLAFQFLWGIEWGGGAPIKFIAYSNYPSVVGWTFIHWKFMSMTSPELGWDRQMVAALFDVSFVLVIFIINIHQDRFESHTKLSPNHVHFVVRYRESSSSPWSGEEIVLTVDQIFKWHTSWNVTSPSCTWCY